MSTWVHDEELQVERVGDTNFINVTFISENPVLSAFVVNTLCSEYIRYTNYKTNNSDRDDSLQFFSDLAEKKKKELEGNVGAWIKGIKTEDPDKIAEKKIKMNLNIITPDNFEVIKEEILKLASEKLTSNILY